MWWVLPFCMGFTAATLLWISWRAFQLYLDLRLTRLDNERAIEMSLDKEIHARAWESVTGCRKRLRFRREVNPRWVEPLKEEIPKMVREIAAIYHPEEPEPMQAPKMSEFVRAIELLAADISKFLQSRRAGRLLDLSAGSALRTWEKGRDIAKHPKVRTAHKIASTVYLKARPIVQLLRIGSPITWASIAVSNAAARTLQPAIINLIGHRAIQLYSGELRRGSLKEDEEPVDIDKLEEITGVELEEMR